MACSLKRSLSGPVTVQKFFQCFGEAWRNNTITLAQYERAPPLHVPRRIGIAVSGGADSMALAYLCRQLQVTKPELDLILKAFIIDHKAREESSEEAHRVAKWLSDLGIDAEILALDWSLEKNAAEMVTAFETQARRKRYRALGRACYENRLGALLTGHHFDDNVETAILRLTQRSKREGLAGIAPVARIPECHGLWGLSESGSFQKMKGRQQRGRYCDGVQSQKANTDTTRNNDLSHITTTNTSSSSFNMATGGILLCRPLLPFRKSSILETCHQSNVPYVTDPTNFDATLTARNAIRSLLAANRLPRALRASSMSSFLSKNRDSLRDVRLQTDELLQECKLLEFHAGSTTMEVQFPSRSILSTNPNSARIQAATLRRITELVSPLEDGKNHSLNEYDRFARMIFTGQQTEDFTVAGAHYRLLRPDNNDEKETGPSPSSINNDNSWHISRAPFRARSEPMLTIEEIHDDWCTPILWDNRYWFQFRLDPSSSSSPSSSSPPSGPSRSIRVRPLKSKDMSSVNRLLKNTERSKSVFRYMAPFKSRFTLPIMTTITSTTLPTDENIITNGEEEEIYLALPTLDMRLGDIPDFPRIEWKWGYKKIDVEALRLMGWLDN